MHLHLIIFDLIIFIAMVWRIEFLHVDGWGWICRIGTLKVWNSSRNLIDKFLRFFNLSQPCHLLLFDDIPHPPTSGSVFIRPITSVEPRDVPARTIFDHSILNDCTSQKYFSIAGSVRLASLFIISFFGFIQAG